MKRGAQYFFSRVATLRLSAFILNKFFPTILFENQKHNRVVPQFDYLFFFLPWVANTSLDD